MNARWSLRRRLTGRVLALVLGSWLATVALSALVLDHEMNEMFDEELQALVETTILSLDAGATSAAPRLVGVQTNDGERVLRLSVPGQTSSPAPWPGLEADGFHDAPGWRILRRTAEGRVIEAAHATDWRREEMLEAAAAFLAMALPLVGLLLWGLGRIVTQTTLPVQRLARAVAGRAPEDLSPVAGGDLPDEVLPLVAALDGYLARIASLRDAERQFIAHAAHELRTPLASLRAGLQDHPQARAQIDALTRRVERLLQLSRLETGLGLGRGPADLVRILRMLLDELRPRARHPIRLDDGDLDRLSVAADPDALAILLRNLIENALEHGTGPVRITLDPSGGLSIQNPAENPHLPQARFAPGLGSAGSGLGLWIVRDLARALQVPLTLTTEGGTVRAHLAFAPV